jgi:hypothetical protein
MVELSWQRQMKVVVESLVVIYIATFFLGLFYTHRGTDWLVSGVLVGALYLFVFISCIARIIKKLSMPALMIAAPTIPLIILIFVLSLIPILQLIH